MAQRTSFASITAECGHEYRGYLGGKPWRYCAPCMTARRLAMKAENEERAALLASAPAAAGFKVTRAKRLRIYERDEWTCQLCLEPVDPTIDPGHDMAASLDHIVCRSWGGDNRDANLRLAHRICNALRGDEGRWSSRLAAICAS